jgi:multidrug efflux pump subunit AcrB
LRKDLGQGIDSIVDNIGLPISGINLAYGNSGTIGSSDADILITLKEEEASRVPSYTRELRERLPRKFPSVLFSFLPADIVTQILNFGLPSPLDIQISGNKIATNRSYAENLLRKVARIPGVVDSRIQQAFNAPTIDVDVNRTFAALVGLSERDIATNMQVNLSGSIQTTPTFWLNPENGVSYPIVAQTPQRLLDSLGALQALPVGSTENQQILASVSKFGRSQSDAVVSHYNIQPSIDIYASVQGRDVGAVSKDIEAVIRDPQYQPPAGSTVSLRGQVQTMKAAYGQLYAGIGFAIVLIYLLIVVNFQSWLDAFVIVCALPMAMAGIVWMLFVSSTTLSVPALTGAIMCMGVATANSILVISFARSSLADGKEASEAAIEAGFSRFRPVLMTSLAMVIGMSPMALSAEQNAPLGRAVIGGLVFSTIASLFLVPIIFTLVHGTKSGARNEE